jgi:acyl carrier protein
LQQARSEADIRAWCMDHLAKALARPVQEIDPNATFSRLGVDSAMAVFLVVELEAWLDIELAPNIAFEYPTIEDLARHLAGQGEGNDQGGGSIA